LQTQLQNIQAPPPSAATGVSSGAPGALPSDGGTAPASGRPAAAAPAANQNQAPPLQETFQAGVRDYNAARYGVASGEFQDVLRYYPLDDLAGAAQFYLGEIAYRQQKFTDAVKAYNAVLEGFPGSSRAPAAQLRKGLALLQLDKKTAGIHELEVLIQRHPQTPEAAQARTKLNAIGVKIVPAAH
jgi:tol-pal system protein YbgF